MAALVRAFVKRKHTKEAKRSNTLARAPNKQTNNAPSRPRCRSACSWKHEPAGSLAAPPVIGPASSQTTPSACAAPASYSSSRYALRAIVRARVCWRRVLHAGLGAVTRPTRCSISLGCTGTREPALSWGRSSGRVAVGGAASDAKRGGAKCVFCCARVDWCVCACEPLRSGCTYASRHKDCACCLARRACTCARANSRVRSGPPSAAPQSARSKCVCEQRARALKRKGRHENGLRATHFRASDTAGGCARWSTHMLCLSRVGGGGRRAAAPPPRA